MKKQLLKGFGLALVLFSPLWIVQRPANYVNFAVAAALGVLLLYMASQTSE